MTAPRDPFERLRVSDPARDRKPASPASDRAEKLFRNIVTSGPRKERIPRPRWRRVPVIVAAVLLLAAAAYALTQSVTEPLTVGCYRKATLDSDVAVISARTSFSAVDLCQAVWQPGGEFASDTNGQPPRLAACVLGTGAIGVFPSSGSDDVCLELGLDPVDESPDDDNQRAIDLQEALLPHFLDMCLDQTGAESAIEEELEQSHLTDWRVVSDQAFTADRPCASLAIDSATRTIELVPISP